MRSNFVLRHHYAPESRIRSKGVIIIRQAGDPFFECEQEAKIIFDKARRLLATVETWLEYSIDNDIKEQTVQALYNSIQKTLMIATKDMNELIIKYQLVDEDDINTIKDVAIQLQEIADDIFNSNKKQ